MELSMAVLGSPRRRNFPWSRWLNADMKSSPTPPPRYTAARCELGGKESSPEECTLPTGVAPSGRPGTTLQGSLSAAFSLLQIILEDQ